jgi:hypothetical protein
VEVGSERRQTFPPQAAEGLPVLDVAPSRDAMERCMKEVAAGRVRRPVLVLGIDGASGPTRPERARGRRPGQGRHRAQRAQWKGPWRDATGWRFALLEDERLLQLLGWHPVPHEAQLGQGLKQVRDAGVIPAGQVRLCVVCEGAAWRGKPGQLLLPRARQGLDYSPCQASLHKVAQVHYASAERALEWVDATLPRRSGGKVGWVLGGRKRLPAASEEAAQALSNCWAYLDAHRARSHYRQGRRGG